MEKYWETPTVDEIALNSEIGAYQDDLDRPVDGDWLADGDQPAENVGD